MTPCILSMAHSMTALNKLNPLSGWECSASFMRANSF